MVTLSISPKIIKGKDIVLISRNEYEFLLHAVKAKGNIEAKKIPAWLKTSLEDVKKGRISGPFNTTKELRASLES
ncbi:MAG: hypothetical protein AAB428_02745 [Patescibacteria group bacterium]